MYRYPNVDKLMDIEFQTSIAELRELCEGSNMTEENWEDIGMDVRQAYKYPQDRVWAMRNLTIRQIVRSDALTPPRNIVGRSISQEPRFRKLWDGAKARKGCKGPREYHYDDYEPLTLPQVFILLVTTSNPKFQPAFEKKYKLHDGPWVTYAVDVVPLDIYLARDDGTWTDVRAGEEGRCVRGRVSGEIVGRVGIEERVRPLAWVET
jgi:hypothetical protein